MTGPESSHRSESHWEFVDDEGTFVLSAPDRCSYLYFPLANDDGLMSCVTPTLQGDAKTGQSTFLLPPVSVEDLHHGLYGRNFWLRFGDGQIWSTVGLSARQRAEQHTGDAGDDVRLEAGPLWHRAGRQNPRLGVRAETLSFVPPGEVTAELLSVTVTNTSAVELTVTPTAAVPIFGRSADSLRDHRHVTSLLQRIQTSDCGVVVRPTLVFDERGHRENRASYGVFGSGPDETAPVGFYPILMDFVGEGGGLDWPAAVVTDDPKPLPAGRTLAGYEALGGLRFAPANLSPGAAVTYRLVLSIAEEGDHAAAKRYLAEREFAAALAQTKQHWQAKARQLVTHSADPRFDRWLRWVTIQPVLRRIYGCSFLPYHDYGRGGRGWRDLWQDCLALLLCEPLPVREQLLGNFAGVRIDGSNATIIGNAPGEFQADRNRIPRVWMDHGAWPWLTTKLYLDQSGDLEFLLQDQAYFRDAHVERCRRMDQDWSPADGTVLRTADGRPYAGSVLEHLVIQHVTSFFNVGEHNNILLEGADWNDGLDLAPNRGESVALTALYGGNLVEMAQVLEALQRRLGLTTARLARECLPLLDTLGSRIDYASPSAKRELLATYLASCNQAVSEDRVAVPIEKLAADLRAKGNWILEHIRTAEWIEGPNGSGWFNGYYDDDGRRVEGNHEDRVRMTLTGQVFAVMCGAATEAQVETLVRSADRHLWNEQVGGYRLNTDFQDVCLKLGRCFGFAFGHKENGAMFSHMAVMFAYALYARDRVGEAFRVLNAIYRRSCDFETARIYPGIPEYFNDRGRGMYPYLTGSASWYLLTLLTMAYGVRGRLGDLALQPRLVPEQFDTCGEAGVETEFADRRLRVVYRNPDRLDASQYQVAGIRLDGRDLSFDRQGSAVVVQRDYFVSASGNGVLNLDVDLE